MSNDSGMNGSEDLASVRGQLKDAEERLRAVLECAAGIHWYKDINGVYRNCNQAMADALGLNSIEDIIDKIDYELPWFEQADMLVNNDKLVMETGLVQHGKEESVQDKQGNLHVFMVAKSPLYDNKGKIIGTVGNSIDITAQKNMEKELIIAKEKAEEANEMKIQFIQNMHHDIRTPLSGIYQYLLMLMDWVKDEEQEKYIQMVINSTAQLLNMCNEIADFDNVEYTKDTLIFSPVESKRFFSRVIDLNKTVVKVRNLTLSFEFDPDVPSIIKMDKVKVGRVLANLVGNAVKFTEKGSVTLRVSCLEKDSEKAKLLIEVIDTGIGIPKEKQELVFEKFVRLSPSNRAKYKGSGLGLYYVKKFVESMHGNISVASEGGVGTTFSLTLTFPVALPTEKPVDERYDIDTYDESGITELTSSKPTVMTENKSTISAADTSDQTCKILSIEDDKILQISIKNTLTKLNCEVICAEGVQTGITALALQRYNLILCDMGLGDGTGLDVMAWASTHEHPNQQTPFIVLTANRDKEVHDKALASGFLAVLQKPLDLKMSEDIIKRYTNKSALPQTRVFTKLCHPKITTRFLTYHQNRYQAVKLLVPSYG